MVIVLLWVVLGALAIGALNWLFPAWHDTEDGAGPEQDAAKLSLVRRAQVAPEPYHFLPPDSRTPDAVGSGQGEQESPALRPRTAWPGDFLGDRLHDLLKGRTMRNHTATDPVCKMQVDPATAPAKAEYKGQMYYFCSRGCKAAFEKDPEHYLEQPEQQRPQHVH